MYALAELQERFDIDCLIDVHTHPFAHRSVNFSGVDDRDEINFVKFINENFDDMHYASIVFSQEEYEARYWRCEGGKTSASPLAIKTSTTGESIRNSKEPDCDFTRIEPELAIDGFLNRTALALGHETLKEIVGSSSVMIVGVGGLGSVIAENLVHMGFERLILVDDDIVEKSNLNRIVGAYWEDAEAARPKVEAVARHLGAIRPSVVVRREQKKIEDVKVDAEIASLDWIILATDNHSSRFAAQELAFKLFIPFISAGVAITVDDGMISDYSGEVIVVRPGDRFCLTCLNRLNPTKIAFERASELASAEQHTGRKETADHADLRPDLQRLKGYVLGANVKEPAVKTLNSVLGALAVEQLIDQYTGRTEQQPILVYERNKQSVIYGDVESLENRNKNCITCGIITNY
ncbi:HesA/MoeB/ThiF family protein [Roseovarius sp.]|uniref:HesA/MoeB/ThiF family protein n=1 Tax=Roseovarius sp. TaxID=1486281 RepID=UPI003A9822C0